MSCGIGCRRSLDLTWLWLWRRPAAVGPIAWEPPYASDAALKSKKKKKSVCGVCMYVLYMYVYVYIYISTPRISLTVEMILEEKGNYSSSVWE